jgi:hypothetical protein
MRNTDWMPERREPPLHTHRFYRNLSKTEPAELLVFQVQATGQPLTIRVD